MLYEFLAANRELLIARCSAMVIERRQSPARDQGLVYGIPIFLDQLIETLTIEQTAANTRSFKVSGQPGGGAVSEIGETASLHGREMLAQGFTLDQVVRDYGDVCQAVTNLAFEINAAIGIDEFRTLNRCLDNAIAGAVTEFAFLQATIAATDELQTLDSRLAPLAHELRNYLHVAMHAVAAIKAGSVGISGATGAVLDRSLLGMRNLIDSSLADVRVTAGLPPRTQPVSLGAFLSEVESAASLDPRARGTRLTVTPVDADMAVLVDPEMLASAVGNLLQNAFKFTRRGTEVTLHAYRASSRIIIEVKDHCGGLPEGFADDLLRPFTQKGADRSGLGLGLDICRRGVEANHGSLRVRDLPGVGCVFTLDLPEASSIV
jgi:signal transduction histidine kinase